ncbi:MAG: beta/gamma crystallin-related protein [Opitutales bacterium]|jgi:hypothetical protein|nr:beta/gamma crystallin-related protein [bacterium]MDG2167068.1 beta/gamma crystallin-related protein [Opitutales bacterium]
MNHSRPICSVILLLLLSFLSTSSIAQPNIENGHAVLYSGQNYSGASYRLVPGEEMDATGQLDSTGLWPSQEYMVGSIEIHGDVVLHLYNDLGFQGNLMKVSQSISDMRRIRNRPIGSLRLLLTAGVYSAPQSQASATQVRPTTSIKVGEVRMYENGGFNGQSLTFDKLEIVGDLNRVGQSRARWNDRISSIYIKGDYSVILFQDANFKGHSLRIDESVSNLKDLRRRDPKKRNWNDAVSSFEIIPKNGDGLYSKGQPRYAGTIYEDANFQGGYMALYDGQQVSNLRDKRWNDKLSSVMVERGFKIILYQAKDFGGESITLDIHQPTMKSFPGDWNDTVSSLKVVRSQ